MRKVFGGLRGFWEMIHRGGASEGFWRSGVFGGFWGFWRLGVFGVFGPKYGKNASKSVVFGNSCNSNDILNIENQ